jgi:EAL domain-containing protein (putative c-di-GMP-specific phosphodiesterase class I)
MKDGTEFDKFISTIISYGVIYLDDTYIDMGDYILAGIAEKSLWSFNAYEPFDDTKPVILLAHDPKYTDLFAGLGADLVLTGHIHGGQIILPGKGALLSPEFCFFPPYYQGIYDNEKKHIHHYESLMRLEDENGRIYYPGSFLDVARSYGLLYDSLSSLMIHKVFERFRLIEGTSVSLNLSIRDIKNRDLVEYIFEFLSTARHPENFVFEILENEDIDNYDELIAFVDRIHDLGALISIDDFGSGFSNLIHIANIHSDYLKIDGSIVKRCCDDKESENLIALISNWRKLIGRDIRIIAEFVENESIQMKLLDYKIDFSQGYLFSKPSPNLNI